MLSAVATPRLLMKVRTMIRPNRVSEIRSIGSSTGPKGTSVTSDIESNAHRIKRPLNQTPVAQSSEASLLTISAGGADLSTQRRREVSQDDRTLRLHVRCHRLRINRPPRREPR